MKKFHNQGHHVVPLAQLVGSLRLHLVTVWRCGDHRRPLSLPPGTASEASFKEYPFWSADPKSVLNFSRSTHWHAPFSLVPVPLSQRTLLPPPRKRAGEGTARRRGIHGVPVQKGRVGSVVHLPHNALCLLLIARRIYERGKGSCSLDVAGKTKVIGCWLQRVQSHPRLHSNPQTSSLRVKFRPI